MRRMAPVVVLALAFGLATCAMAEERLAPDFSLSDVNGKMIQLSQYRGKAILLNFWATWCPSCWDEIRGLVRLKEWYGPRGLEIIGASVDVGGMRKVKAYATRAKINYPVVIADRKLLRAFGYISGVPTTFLIDPQGRIIKKYLGFKEEAVFERDLKPLLQSP